MGTLKNVFSRLVSILSSKLFVVVVTYEIGAYETRTFNGKGDEIV